jgi:hypothetical protein
MARLKAEEEKKEKKRRAGESVAAESSSSTSVQEQLRPCLLRMCSASKSHHSPPCACLWRQLAARSGAGVRVQRRGLHRGKERQLWVRECKGQCSRGDRVQVVLGTVPNTRARPWIAC